MMGMNKFGIPLAMMGLLFITGCNKENKPAGQEETKAGGFARSKTLYLGGSQWGDPNSFNPLTDWPAWPVNDKFNIMFETLLAYNTLTGKFEPLLGTLESQSADSVVVVLNPAAKWSDGQPVTSADVKFVYELGKRFKGAATAYAIDFVSDIKVSATADKAERLTFMVNKKGRNNPLVVLDFLQAIRILPAHIFEPKLAQLKDLAEVQKLKCDSNPVVSGPYNLETYSNEKIILKRRDDYWGNAALHGGKLAGPQFIIHPIYKSNDAFAIALAQNDLDATQTYIPRIWMKKNAGVMTWYDKEPYFVPGAVPTLLINSTRYPLSDKAFRRAMAFAIDYKSIKDLAVSGYSPDIKPGAIMPFGIEAGFYNDEDAQKYGAAFNVESAKKILADAGYKSVFKADGTLDKMIDGKGKPVPTLFVKSPAGWSDWEAIVTLAVKGMRAAGIDVREGFVDAGLYWQSQPVGDFDLEMIKPAASVTPSQPWSRLAALMSSRTWAPPGEKMNENQGRFNNPKGKGYIKAVDSLLSVIPTLTDKAALTQAYRQLNILFMQEQPALPLCYLPEQFYQVNTKTWTNWASEANPYAPPNLPWAGAATKMLWELKPAK